MTSSGQSKKSTKSQSYPAVRSHASRFSLLRGNPSIRNVLFPESFIAPKSRFTVTSLGTIWPCLIISATMLPSALPDFMCARSKSPALRCVNPKSRTMFAHCVPLPAPGPPSTNTTVGCSAAPPAEAGAAADAEASPASAHAAVAAGAKVASVAAANPNATGARAVAGREAAASEAERRARDPARISRAATHAREAEACAWGTREVSGESGPDGDRERVHVTRVGS